MDFEGQNPVIWPMIDVPFLEVLLLENVYNCPCVVQEMAGVGGCCFSSSIIVLIASSFFPLRLGIARFIVQKN